MTTGRRHMVQGPLSRHDDPVTDRSHDGTSGKHMMSVFVQYAPPKVEGREWTDEDKDGFEKSVIDQISNYSPNFRDSSAL